jgi:ribonuclease-3
LGYCPHNIKLYQQAFLHNSHSVKIPGISESADNERLEYLGDAVLDLIIAELLFKKFPFKGEGFLTEMRSKSVSRKMLSTIAYNMGLQDHLVYNKSISKNQAAVQGMAGNALEALVGAVYLDRGYPFAKRFVKQKIVNPYLDFDELKDITVNFKSLLNQYAQKEKKTLEFKVLNPESEKKIKTYSIAVCINGDEISTARGKSKKVAEQIASEKACEILKLIPKAI